MTNQLDVRIESWLRGAIAIPAILRVDLPDELVVERVPLQLVDANREDAVDETEIAAEDRQDLVIRDDSYFGFLHMRVLD